MWIKLGLVGTLAAVGVDLPIWTIIALVGGTGLVGLVTLTVEHNPAPRRRRVVALQTLLGRLQVDPTNSQYQANLVRFLDASPTFTSPELASIGLTSGLIYRQILQGVAAHPQSIETRDCALKVGRWHYSLGRDDRRPRMDDEQAIQNDLFVRIWNRSV